MKHIDLLTMESYLETKRELMENANYPIRELHIDHTKRLIEIIEEIKEEYFEGKNDKQHMPLFISTIKQGGDYEVEVRNSLYSSQYEFMTEIKEKYKRLMNDKQEVEISNDIERVLNTVYIYSCRLGSDIEKRMHEIIKYTLTDEQRCDCFNNGKFMKEMDEKDIYPFEKQGDTLPLYCQDMQRVLFGVHRKIFEVSKSLDITRFGFHEVKKIVDEVTKALKHNKYQEITENSEDSSGGYTEKSEDYILLDKILGISLTNIIYWKTKKIKEREMQDNIIRIINPLMKCQYSVGRNSVAQVLLEYLSIMEFDEKIIRILEEVLKKKVKVWNEYYEEIEAAILIPVFSYLVSCPVSDYIEVCKNIEKDNSWGEYIYMDDIANSEEMTKAENSKENTDTESSKDYMNTNKIRIPKGDMNNRTWYAYIHKSVFEAIWRE